MNRRVSLPAALAAGALLVIPQLPGGGGGTVAAATPTRTMHICAPARPGYATCLAVTSTLDGVRPAVTSGPKGYGPADLRAAYKLSATAGAGKTVAIIDAFNDPTAAADLTRYRSTFHLPSCTTSSGCFRKVSQTGSTTRLPRTDAGWAGEISLDLDMVSAACPACKILLVEANSASMPDLGAAVNYAASQHVSAISNSYGGPDSGAIAAFNHPGIAIVASAGDEGYFVEAPASFRTVIAVGGTTLRRSSNARGWSETAWSGTGSGCSTRNVHPAWQTLAITHCTGKVSADVAAVADPATGVAVYDSTPVDGMTGWQVVGGTSASAPIIASVYAMSGNTAGYPASYTWTHAGGLNDVTSGSNGTCRFALWCHAARGWDGPTGLGTPRGTSAF